MASSQKLIYLANLRLPTEKAYGIQIAQMCEAFATLGRKVELVAPYRRSDIREDFFVYYGVKNSFRFRTISVPDFYLFGRLNIIALGIKNFISAVKLSKYALHQRPDVFYSRDELVVFILSFLSDSRKIIFEAHKFSSRRALFYKRFKNKNIKTVVITHRLKEDFIRDGFRPENIAVAPDAVNIDDFNISFSKEEARKKIGVPIEGDIAMYTGHLFAWKGADTLLKAARYCPNVLFVFVGGTLADIENFKKAASDLDNVRIIGRKPHREIPIFLKAADILVLPNSGKEEISKSYTSPLKLFEYMASGRPIVASNLPSLREILNENNSVFVEPDNAESLSGGIKKVLEDNALADQIGAQGFKDVEKFTWQARAQNILTYMGF